MQGMNDLGIRNNMLRRLMGTIPTIARAGCLAGDERLDRPSAFAAAPQVAASTLRPIKLRKGQMAFVASFSACFDRLELKAASEFRTDRA